MLLLFLLVSCTGHQKINHRFSAPMVNAEQDCKILIKKQKHQYNIASREAKANHKRRKPIVVKNKNKEYDREHLSDLISTPTPAFNISTILRNFKQSYPLLYQPYFNETPSHLSDKTEEKSLSQQKKEITLKSNESQTFETKTVIKNTVVSENFYSSSGALLLMGLSGLAGMMMLRFFQKNARGLSSWAAQNPWKARSTIVLAQAVTGVASLWLGNYLYAERIMIPEYSRLVLAGMVGTAAILYPNKYHPNGSPAFSYTRRKFHDIALYTAGAMMIVYAANHYDFTVQPVAASQTVSSLAPSEKLISVNFIKSKISLVKKGFNERLKVYASKGPKKERTRGQKIALTILASLGFAVLSGAVAALACNISCSGNEAAAIAVFIAGEALVIWGLVASIRSIHNMRKKEKTMNVQPGT